MKFALIPAGGEDTASSRIRVYTLQRALIALGHAADVKYSSDADVLFVQKRASRETCESVRLAKARGCIVLYDVDDLGEALWHFVPPRCFYEMICLADVVTTDTEGHREYLVRKCGISRVEVIPDTIDYYPSSPVRLPIEETKLLRIFWFGFSVNLALFERYALALAAIPDVEIVVSTNASAIPKYSDMYPEITFLPWSQNFFLSQLQSCHLCCLMHDGSSNDRCKSNNKMIAAITWGVPALVSRTPEYERTAREAGIENAAFSNEQELLMAVERMRSASARRAYLDKAQADIWTRYSPVAVATQFVELTSKCFNQRPKAPAKKQCPDESNSVQRLIRSASYLFWRLKITENRPRFVKALAFRALKRSRDTVARKFQ